MLAVAEGDKQSVATAGGIIEAQAAVSRVYTSFWWRFLQLNAGLLALGLAQSLMLQAKVGLSPWAVFHHGVSRVSGLSFGLVLVLAGVIVVALGWWLTGQRPGLGTVLNMVLVGVWTDLFEASGWIPAPEALALQLGQFLLGTLLVGAATGLYVMAKLGAGPRDSFVIGVAQRVAWSVRAVRFALEGLVLLIGLLLGGSAGAGTIIFVLLIGPLMQYFLRFFGREQRSI